MTDLAPEDRDTVRLSHYTYMSMIQDALMAKHGTLGEEGIEACGLLSEHRDRRPSWPSSLRYHRSRNVSQTPTNSFLIDPELQMELKKNTHVSVVGMAHSHPRGEARPSDLDRESYCPEGFLYGVIGMSTGQPLLAMFRYRSGIFVACDLVIV